jgi:hypothetical protein
MAGVVFVQEWPNRIKFGDRIGDNPRVIRSDPFHGEQFVLSARAY